MLDDKIYRALMGIVKELGLIKTEIHSLRVDLNKKKEDQNTKTEQE